MGKKILWLGGGALIVLIVLLVVAIASAQAPAPTPTPGAPSGTPEPGAVPGWPGGGRGWGGPWGLFGGGPGDRWTTFDAAAEALGLTPEELFSELHAGKTLAEIAEAQGVDIQVVQEAMKAVRVEAMKQAIAQAVQDGKMTQEQADWLLEGIEKGYMPMGRGFGPMGPGRGGRGWHGCGSSSDE